MIQLQHLIDRIEDAIRRAEEREIHLPNAMSLATVGPDGRPSNRVVLLKNADERGFVFYTNMESRKARELSANPAAALCFWWGPMEEQVRVEGAVVRVDDDEADAYFASRPRGSQLAACVSRQSEELTSTADLLEDYTRLERENEGKDVARPAFWSGYRLIPGRIEFWAGRPNRLHERFVYEKEGDDWVEKVLYP